VALKLFLIINPARAICVFRWQTVCLRRWNPKILITRKVVQLIGTFRNISNMYQQLRSEYLKTLSINLE